MKNHGLQDARAVVATRVGQYAALSSRAAQAARPHVSADMRRDTRRYRSQKGVV